MKQKLNLCSYQHLETFYVVCFNVCVVIIEEGAGAGGGEEIYIKLYN